MRYHPLAALVFCAFCESNEVPAPPRSFDLGDGAMATFGGDGSLVITRDGAPLLATPAGMPLVTRALDAETPGAWHDPTQTTAYAFSNIDARAVDVESPTPGVLHVTTKDDGAPTTLVRITLASDDGFYTGMGERFGHVSARGAIVPMQLMIDAKFESATNDAHVPVPLLVSSKGYGVFFESRESGAFDVAKTDAGTITVTFEGKAVNAWFFFARDPLEVVAKYMQHVGLPRAVPRWALGPFYWRNTWDSQAQMEDDAAMMRNLHIPTTTMWIDNPWQTSYDTFVPDPARFPDPQSLAAYLGALGYRFMFWSEPYLEKPGTGPDDEARQLYAQAAAQPNLLLRLAADGSPFAALGSDDKLQFGMIDFSTSAGRDFWAGLASRAVTLGASGFKLDYGEDVVPAFFNARLGIDYADGETDRTARNYPLGYHAAYHEALDAQRTDGFLLVRASTYGGASIADAIWPGDLDNDFSKYGDASGGVLLVGGLPSAVVAAETLSASGFPAFGSDTGGFRHGAPTKEALLRWAEHTAFSVIMQNGGGGDTHAPWAYDDETVSLYRNLAAMHTELEPYLSSLLRAAETAGTPTIRPLPLAFPSDAAGFAAADDEYMLGPDLLIAPIVTQGVTARSVHFPPGAWVRLATNDLVQGPADATVDAPLGAGIAYGRVGALVPMLAADIDTLVSATAGATITVAQRPTVEARGWPSGDASARFDDGAQISVHDAQDGVTVSFVPNALATAIVATLDLRSRTGKTTPLTHVVSSGVDLPAAANEAAVRASSASTYFLAGDSIVLRLAGAITATIE